MDGLLHAVCRLRFMRDLCASCLSASVCDVFGLASFESAGSFCSLFLHDLDLMPQVIEAAQWHGAVGVFVVRCSPGIAWYDSLVSRSLRPIPLIFDLPLGTCGTPEKVVGVYASFSPCVVGLRKKRRPERSFSVSVIPSLSSPTGRLGPRPRLLHRVSPLVGELPVPPTQVLVSSPLVPPMVSRWRQEDFIPSVPFPCPVTQQISSAVAGPGLDPFLEPIVDDVRAAPRPLTQVEEAAITKKLVQSKEKGGACGPFPEAPFASFREVPPFTVPKDKYDVVSEEVRPVFDFSAVLQDGGPSTNGRGWDPRFLRENLSSGAFRDELMYLLLVFGVVYGLAADVPNCFENNHVNPRLLPLMMCIVGGACWVKTCTSFGWSPSEWGWQGHLAIILWKLRLIDYSQMMAYCDNFYALFSAVDDVHGHERVLARFFESMNVPLHEWQRGTIIKCLGWIFDFSDPKDPVMICPEGRFGVMCALILSWVSRKMLSLHEVEKAVGILMFLASAFTIGRADLVHLVAMRTAGQAAHRKAEAKARRSLSRKSIACAVLPAAAGTFRFWNEFFPLWDRRAPVFLDFGPTAHFQCLIRIDASTDFGCGGFLFIPGVERVFAFVHKWSVAERELAVVLQRESTGVMEMWAVQLAMELFAPFCIGRRVLLESDSVSAVFALNTAFSSRPLIMRALRDIRMRVARSRIILRVCHIFGVKFNLVADHLSHNRLAQAQFLAVEEFGFQLFLLPSPGIR